MATTYTPNLNLPKYEAEDKPNLLDQYNASMDLLDVDIKTLQDTQVNDKAEIEQKIKDESNSLGNIFQERISILDTRVQLEYEETTQKFETEKNEREAQDNQIKSDLEQANNDIADNSIEIAKLKNSVNKSFKTFKITNLPFLSSSSKIQANTTEKIGFPIVLTGIIPEEYNPITCTFDIKETSQGKTTSILTQFDFNQKITPTQLTVWFTFINFFNEEKPVSSFFNTSLQSSITVYCAKTSLFEA